MVKKPENFALYLCYDAEPYYFWFFDHISSKSRPILKKIYVSNILDQNATFLLNNFFTLLSEKNLILQISLKSALEIFSILLFHTALGVCYLAMVMSDLCLFKTPNTC